MRLFILAALYTYRRNEKLKSRKLTEQLFAHGKTFVVFPLKVIYLPLSNNPHHPVKVGVGASKRSFKKAVQRNRIKRLLREAYRLNKLPLHQFLKTHNLQLAFFILFTDKHLPQQAIIQDKMLQLLGKLIKNLSVYFENLNNLKAE